MSKMYDKIVNEETREATLTLYGSIGGDIDANEFARDLIYIGQEYDTVNIHINSPGGSVIDGMSIVSAIITAKAKVVAYVDGVAASMAAIVAVASDYVIMQDFAKMMIHDPFFSDNPNNLDEKQKKALKCLTDMSQEVLSRRGCNKDKIASLMHDETWFSADEAKAIGLCDEICKTSKKKEMENLSTATIMSLVMNEYKPKIKKEDMKEIAKALSLPETSTEAEILQAITKRNELVESLQKMYSSLLLEQGRKMGIVTDENVKMYERLICSEPALFGELLKANAEKMEEVESNTTNGKRLSDALSELKAAGMVNEGLEKKSKKDFLWLSKNDPEALKKIERENPKEFERLLNEYEEEL